MALQVLKGGWWVPPPMWAAASAPAFSIVTFDAQADRASAIFRAPKTGSIDQLAVLVGAVTTSAPLDLRLETVITTSTGTPSGTLVGTTTEATNLTPTADTLLSGTMTLAASVTRGQTLALVVQPTGAAAINLAINRVNAETVSGIGGQFPYGSQNTTGSYANSQSIMCCAVRYTTGEWVFVSNSTAPIQTLPTAAFNTGTGATTGTMRGLRFQLTAPQRLSGCWVKMSLPANADFNVKLYSGAGSLLQTMVAAFDANQQRAASTSGLWMLDFDGDYDCAASTEYFLVLEPTTANSLTLAEFTVNAAAHMDAFPGGQAFHLAAFVSSAWVKTTTARPWMGLRLTASDDAAGGGGGGSAAYSRGRVVNT